ncbi:MAG: alanine racemase, partial [Brevinema sp.]
KFCFAIKANAYGHGLVGVALHTMDMVDFFAVATIGEAVQLREAGIKKPILILSPFLSDEISLLFEYDLTPVLSHLEFLQQYVEYAQQFHKKISVHLKVNTGMNRNGFDPAHVLSAIKKIIESECFILEGLCTHLASADELNTKSKKITEKQLNVFEDIVYQVQDIYQKPLICHSANTAGAIYYEQSLFDMVRVGSGAYGYPLNTSLVLKPVMELKSKIVLTKYLKKDDFVSYGATWYADRDTNIAIIPIGYADGIFRSLSNRGFVAINDKYFPIVGRVCMDVIIVDTGQIRFDLGTDVLIFGDDCQLNAETLAEQCETISCEIMSKITDRVPRIYKNG